MTVDVPQRVAPVFPSGYPRGPRLAPLLHSAVRAQPASIGRDKRIEITRDDPLRFALLYLPGYLKDELTGVISFSDLHLAAYDRMRRWVDRGPDRSAWAAHRDAGKSVLWFLVAPIWAAAHGHRRFAVLLSYTSRQSTKHLRNLRTALDSGDLLGHDFPHLRRGPTWTAGELVTAGGQRFTAGGLSETLLGLRHAEQRPDLIVGDDLDPGEEGFTPSSKAKSLGILSGDVLPMASRRAAIVLTGTPTAAGSLMHDVVRAVRGRPGALEDRGEWLTAEGFDPHWYPAILDAGTAAERSAWPTHWSLEQLRGMRAASPRTFALQYQCDPDDPAAVQWWTEGTFRFDTRFAADWRILSVDGAVTSKRTDVDHTAVSLLAVGPGAGANRKVCVEHASAGSWSRTELKERIWQIAGRYPKTLRTLLIEGNQGGELWEEILTPPPPGVAIETFSVQGSKRHRIESLYDRYADGTVWHAGRLTALQAQMEAWRPGRGGHGVDDLIDATAAAVRRALYGDASRAPARRGRG